MGMWSDLYKYNQNPNLQDKDIKDVKAEKKKDSEWIWKYLVFNLN